MPLNFIQTSKAFWSLCWYTFYKHFTLCLTPLRCLVSWSILISFSHHLSFKQGAELVLWTHHFISLETIKPVNPPFSLSLPCFDLRWWCVLSSVPLTEEINELIMFNQHFVLYLIYWQGYLTSSWCAFILSFNAPTIKHQVKDHWNVGLIGNSC